MSIRVTLQNSAGVVRNPDYDQTIEISDANKIALLQLLELIRGNDLVSPFSDTLQKFLQLESQGRLDDDVNAINLYLSLIDNGVDVSTVRTEINNLD